MTAAFVQKALSSPGGSPTSLTAIFGAGVGSGNLVVGSCTYSTSSLTVIPASAIADNTGAHPLIIDTLTDANGPTSSATFYFKNVTNGMTSVTFTPTGTNGGISSIFIHEVSGLDTVSPIDVHNITTDDTGHNPEPTPSVTTTANGDYVYAVMLGPVTGFNTITAAGGTGATFTLRNNDATNQVGGDSSAVQTTAGAVQGTFSAGGAGYMTAIVTFKVATGATTPFGGCFYGSPELTQQVQAIGY